MSIPYRREFHYRSLFQVWTGFLLAAMAIACVFALHLHWAFAVLLVLLLAGSAAVWIGIARNDVAWIELRTDSIAWASTGLGAGSDCIPYNRITAVNLRNRMDSQALLVYTDDGDTIACSDLYFGDGIELLDALNDLRPDLPLMLNDARYCGEPSNAAKPPS